MAVPCPVADGRGDDRHLQGVEVSGTQDRIVVAPVSHSAVGIRRLSQHVVVEILREVELRCQPTARKPVEP